MSRCCCPGRAAPSRRFVGPIRSGGARRCCRRGAIAATPVPPGRASRAIHIGGLCLALVKPEVLARPIVYGHCRQKTPKGGAFCQVHHCLARIWAESYFYRFFFSCLIACTRMNIGPFSSFMTTLL